MLALCAALARMLGTLRPRLARPHRLDEIGLLDEGLYTYYDEAAVGDLAARPRAAFAARADADGKVSETFEVVAVHHR